MTGSRRVEAKNTDQIIKARAAQIKERGLEKVIPCLFQDCGLNPLIP